MEGDEDGDSDDGHVGGETQPGEESWTSVLGTNVTIVSLFWRDYCYILRSAAQWSRASESLLSNSRGPSKGRSAKTWLSYVLRLGKHC